MAKKQAFLHHEAAKAEFQSDGLRSYFEYLDLGIKDATHQPKARRTRLRNSSSRSQGCRQSVVQVVEGESRSRPLCRHQSSTQLPERLRPICLVIGEMRPKGG